MMRRYPTRDEIIQQQDDQNWTKEATKEQPMSDMLHASDLMRWCDDCHGYTHMPWCPAYKEPVKESRCELHGGIIGCPCANAKQWSPLDDEHEPAARGGSEGPERIWLSELDAEIQSQKVTREDIEYIRADQHQSLVAERERLRQAIRDEITAIRIWQHAIHPRSDVQEGLAISLSKLEAALNQQRSTPQ